MSSLATIGQLFQSKSAEVFKSVSDNRRTRSADVHRQKLPHTIMQMALITNIAIVAACGILVISTSLGAEVDGKVQSEVGNSVSSHNIYKQHKTTHAERSQITGVKT